MKPILVALLLLAAFTPSHADKVADLERKVADLERKVADLEGKLTTQIDRFDAFIAKLERYQVVLTSPGPKKIEVIKIVRAVTGLGLAESKSLVDAAPRAVKQNISRSAAETIRTQLVEAGALVTIDLR